MPTELGNPFEITWRGYPQQMLETDVPLWYLFLDRFASKFDRFYYNVKVGGPDVTKIPGDPKFAKQWYDVTAKRIDAIGETKKDLWIIEVASSPFLRAVGQCLSYKFLWELDPKIEKPARMVLICYSLDDDLKAVLKHFGVEVIYMPRPPELSTARKQTTPSTGRKGQGGAK
jgi:hypothetical protein